jgi:hypothetical protein
MLDTTAAPAGLFTDDRQVTRCVWCRATQPYLLANLLLGTFSTVLGGYIAARIAKSLPLFNACAVGVVGIAAAILLGGQSDSPWWFNAVGYLTTIPAAIVGGWLARRESKKGP